MCEILFVCLSVCPVQFVFTELQSGSTLLLGVHSIPKSCENSVDPPTRVGYGVRIEKNECRKIVTKCEGSL